MVYRVCKEWTFEAAHQLPLHDGKCRELHGHSYRVRVTASGQRLISTGPKTGMVIDFGDLSAVWKEHLEPLLDHRFLNDTLPVPVTTAEHIAGWILIRFREQLDTGLDLTVRVWETPSCWAEAS